MCVSVCAADVEIMVVAVEVVVVVVVAAVVAVVATVAAAVVAAAVTVAAAVPEIDDFACDDVDFGVASPNWFPRPGATHTCTTEIEEQGDGCDVGE